MNGSSTADRTTPDTPERITCFDGFLEYIRERYADRNAFVFTENGVRRQVSFETFCGDVRRVSRRFSRTGIPVGLLGENRYDWIVLYFAITVSGNIVIPLDTTANRETLLSELDNAGCSNLFLTERFGTIARELRDSSERPLALFPVDIRPETGDETCPLSSPGTPADAAAPTALYKGASVVIYTSGTTSRPKGVLLTQRNLLSNAVSSAKALHYHSRVLSVLPMYHIYGMVCGMLVPLISGCTVFLNDDSRSLMYNLRYSGAETMPAVPAILKMLRDSAADTGSGLSLPGSLRQIICGSAALPADVYDFYNRSGICVQIGYGMSECACVISVNRIGARKGNTVGPAIDRCIVRIKDPDPGGRGEIQIAGDTVMQGYLNAPDLTEQAFDGRFFRSGDIGYLDEDGHLAITGRSKNLLVMSNGKKVVPEELESCIGGMPHVREVLVFLSGGNGERETVAAEIYPDPGADPEQARLDVLDAIDRMNGNLPIYKRVLKVFFRDTEFEKTSTRKIIRKPAAAAVLEKAPQPESAPRAVTRQIAELIARLSGVPAEEITPDSELFTDLGLDSLYYTTLINEVCERYGVTVPEETFRSIRTVRDITSLIRAEKATA